MVHELYLNKAVKRYTMLFKIQSYHNQSIQNLVIYWQFLKKLNIKLLYNTAISLLGIYTQENENTSTQTLVYEYLLHIHKESRRRNNPNACQPMNEQTVIYAYNGILLHHKKEQITDKCYNLDEAQRRYAK